MEEQIMKNEDISGRSYTGGEQPPFVDLEKARKEGRNKGAFTAAIIILLVVITAGIFSYSHYKKAYVTQVTLMETERNAFTDQLVVRDSTLNDWLQTFDQVQKGLNTIKEKENLITVNSASGVEFTQVRKEQIMQDISAINTLLEDNRKKLASLNAQMRNSGREIKGLKEMIATLEAKIIVSENEITALKATLNEKDLQIGSLNMLASELQTTVAQQTETIGEQVSEMNTAWLATGTFKDLKEKGLVSKEGGFLGLGRTETLTEDFIDSLFAQVDITEIKTIPVNSQDARLITEHPSGSYAMVQESENMIAYIEIKDPAQFWKISKYAVVEVVK
jgi:predicted  nucleic acid-binding Zn-ribbon protein